MSLRAFFRKIAGRAGQATRSKRGAKSHVNTKANKRAASKAVRTCGYGKSHLLEEYAKERDIMLHSLPIEYLDQDPTEGDKE